MTDYSIFIIQYSMTIIPRKLLPQRADLIDQSLSGKCYYHQQSNWNEVGWSSQL